MVMQPIVTAPGSLLHMCQAVRKRKCSDVLVACNSCTDEAKDCVKRMLRRDPKHRAKAQDILNHDWLRENGCASDNHIEVGVVSRILRFNQGNKLKKAVTQFMVSKLPLDEIKGLRSIFRSIDVSNTGRVTLKQFADAIKQMGTKLPEADLRALWNVSWLAGRGCVSLQGRSWLAREREWNKCALCTVDEVCISCVSAARCNMFTDQTPEHACTSQGLAKEGALVAVLLSSLLAAARVQPLFGTCHIDVCLLCLA